MLDAYFCYNDYTDLDADEAPCVRAPSDGDWSAIGALISENEDDVGTVVISAGDAEARIVDSLIATIQNVCLDPIPALIERRHVVAKLFMSYGYVRMDPEASDQLILGDYIEPVRFKRAELIPALAEVGRTYLSYLEACREDDDDFASVLEGVRLKVAAADDALAAWDGT
jgi:hypothetical protein